MERNEMIEKLINKKKIEADKEIKGYIKKLNGAVTAVITQLYDLEILGKKDEKEKKWSRKSISKMED